ncbi:MAG: ACT domain-containing protein, partial [Acidimicrobiales bacterium]
LQAAALATPVVPEPVALDEPHRLLLAVRDELHRRAGRATEHLVLQEQDGVAAALGFPDADQLMAAVSSAARTISYASDDGWVRARSALSGPRGRSAAGDRPVARGVLLRDGELVVTEPAQWLLAATASAELGVPFAAGVLPRLATEAPAPGEPWPSSLREAVVALLGAGHAALPVLEALDQHGLLVRLLPEWQAVRSRPQRNAYHRFTVDRHLCEAAANAAALTRDVARPDLLLVGTWLHDIGKGFPGDHTDAGVRVLGQIGPRMGFLPEDCDTLVFMVRHHLLLADVATRRDLDDPATLAAVAEAVGDRDRLDLLAALTEADSRATGPTAWTDWKAGLVGELVARVARVLEGHQPAAVPALTAPALPAGVPLLVEVDGRTLTVVARDRPGLFCRVAGALALNGLDILSGQAGPGPDGTAVEVFVVEPRLGDFPEAGRLRADIERALSGRLAIEPRLAERARTYAARSRPQAARAAEARVLVDNRASPDATFLEVRAPDGVGVLYRITRALADCDLDVRSAKVSTMGHEVVDAFYVTDAAGAKVGDSEYLGEIERAVLGALAGGPG